MSDNTAADNKTITLDNEKLSVSFGAYENGELAIHLYCENGELYTVATVNLDVDHFVMPGYVLFKEQFGIEMEDMLAAFREAGIITDGEPHPVAYGYNRSCTAYEAELTEEMQEALYE